VCVRQHPTQLLCLLLPRMRPVPAQLRLIRRAFVNKMLDSSTFNKLLSAARECNRLLSSNDRDPEASRHTGRRHRGSNCAAQGSSRADGGMSRVCLSGQRTDSSQMPSVWLWVRPGLVLWGRCGVAHTVCGRQLPGLRYVVVLAVLSPCAGVQVAAGKPDCAAAAAHWPAPQAVHV
jgi:hypothetical protein